MSGDTHRAAVKDSALAIAAGCIQRDMGETPHSAGRMIVRKCLHMIATYRPLNEDSKNLSPQREPNLRQRILVVEDDPLIRRLNTEVLVYSGYQVDSTEDGPAAWDALLLSHYDLIVTDNDMPKVTGVEFIRKLQAAHMTLPVIMATGRFRDQEFTRYASLQPAVTLPKP